MPIYENGKETQERLIKAAKELFYAYGPQRVTKTQLAEKACIQVSSMQYYYKNKKELLRDIFLETVTRNTETAEEISTNRPELTCIVYLLLLYRILTTDSRSSRMYKECIEKFYTYNDKQIISGYMSLLGSICSLSGYPDISVKSPLGVENIHSICVYATDIMLRSIYQSSKPIDYKYIAKWNVDFMLWSLGISPNSMIEKAFNDAVAVFEAADIDIKDLCIVDLS